MRESESAIYMIDNLIISIDRLSKPALRFVVICVTKSFISLGLVRNNEKESL